MISEVLYPVAKAIYGSPAYNISTVNVRKDPTLSGVSGYYDLSANEMVLRTSRSDALCHEMIHAFRDDNMVGLSTYEEGMTRAAEVEVFNQLPDYSHFDKHHSYTYDVYYESLNNPAVGSQNGTFSSLATLFLLRYQLAGYAWGKALIENSDFLFDFNRDFYARILVDPDVRYQEAGLLAIAAAIQPTVEGLPFQEWYAPSRRAQHESTQGLYPLSAKQSVYCRLFPTRFVWTGDCTECGNNRMANVRLSQ